LLIEYSTNKIIIDPYNKNNKKTSPFPKEISSNYKKKNLCIKKYSNDKNINKSTISINENQNLVMQNNSQLSKLQSPFKDSNCSYLEHIDDAKSNKICDRSLFSPINQIFSTKEFTREINTTSKNSKFSNSNFNKTDIKEDNSKDLLKNLNNFKSKKYNEIPLNSQELRRNYASESAAGDVSVKDKNSKNNLIDNNKTYANIIKKNNSSNNYRKENFDMKNPNQQFNHVDKTDHNSILLSAANNINNKNVLQKSNSSNFSKVHLNNTNTQFTNINTVNSNKEKLNNKVFQKLYNFDEQFMFFKFRKENIDSFFSLQRQFSHKNGNKTKSSSNDRSRRSSKNTKSLLTRKSANNNTYNSNTENIHFSQNNNLSHAINKTSINDARNSILKKSNSFNHFEKLYNHSFTLGDKFREKKSLIEKSFLENSKPQITKKAHNIIRDPNLFHCRLYPYHKIDQGNINVSGFSNKKNTISDNFNYKFDYSHKAFSTKSFAKSKIDKEPKKDKDSPNNSFCGVYSNILENIKKLEGIDDIKSFKIYRTSKKKSKGNYIYDDNQKTNMNNDINNRSCNNFEGSNLNKIDELDYLTNNERNKTLDNFTFTPQINNNSRRIADKLQNSRTRLIKSTMKACYLAPNRKYKGEIKNKKFTFNHYEDSKNITNDIQINNIHQDTNLDPNNQNNTNNRIFSHSFDNTTSQNISKNNPYLYLTTRNKFFLNNTAREIKSQNKNELNKIKFLTINNVKIPERPINLYKKGLESLKKREAKSLEKIINDSQLYKQYSFKPKIDKRISPSIYRGKAIQYGHNDSKRNLNNSNTLHDSSNQASNNIINNNYNNFENPEISISNNYNYVYEKQIIWKNNVERKTKKLKDERHLMENKDCTYRPDILREEMPNDEKFIEKNLNQIQDYVNKRRAIIQKSKEEEKYKEKRLNMDIDCRKFIKKPTIPKEYNITKYESSDVNNNVKTPNNHINNEDKFSFNNNNNNLSFTSINNNVNNNKSKSPFKVERVNFHSINKFRRHFKTKDFFEKDENKDKNIIRNRNINLNKNDCNEKMNVEMNNLNASELLYSYGNNEVQQYNFSRFDLNSNMINNILNNDNMVTGKFLNNDIQDINMDNINVNYNIVSNNNHDNQENQYYSNSNNNNLNNIGQNDNVFNEFNSINHHNNLNQIPIYSNDYIPENNPNSNYIYGNGNDNINNNIYSNNINAYTFYDEKEEEKFNQKNNFNKNFHENSNNNNKELKKPVIKIFNLLNNDKQSNSIINSNNNSYNRGNVNNKSFNLIGQMNKEILNKNKIHNKSNEIKNININNANSDRNFRKNEFDNDNSNDMENYSETIGYPIDQQKFIDAVRNIHDKLINLNL